MKKILLKNLGQVAAVLALVASGSSVFAADTWNLTSCSTSENLGNTETCSSSGSASGLKLYGFSNGTGTTSAPDATSNTSKFAASKIYDWGTDAGLGVVAGNENSGDTGPHAMDNTYGIDAMMIKFSGGAVNLTQLTIGWNGTDNNNSNSNPDIPYSDSDLSVLAWTGSGTPTSNPLSSSSTAASPSSLLSSGWSLVGNYSDVGGLSNNTQMISSPTYSSYWLVSTYSRAFGESWSEGNDAFKLLSLAGNTCSGTVNGGLCNATNTGGGNGVPEPGSLALMGAAMMGFVASRRRKQQAA